MAGYWEPHTSSVDFCEPNYAVSIYVAEFHNVWSSILLSWFGLFGLLYSNPTREKSVGAMYLALIVIGVGSVGLHTTLHWLLQSSDEVPMLWFVLSCVHLLWICRHGDQPVNTNKTGIQFFTVAFVQTVLYYTYQQIYAVFIASMILYVTLLVFWSHSFINTEENEARRKVQVSLHLWSFIFFVLCGFVVWLIDMNLCDYLMPVYLTMTGFTLHVFWHFFAGLGAYYLCVLITLLRVRQQKYVPRIRWYGRLLPYCEVEKREE